MGRYYYMVCMECGEVVNLGKAVAFTDDRLAAPDPLYGFAFTTDGHQHDDGDNISPVTIMTWRYLEHFMMRHRGHELRVLPDLIEKYENDHFPVYAPGDPFGTDEYLPDESYYRSPTGRPDQDRDAARVPDSVVKRLKELQAGKNVSVPIWDTEDQA
ncbi:hypothetical protein ACM0P6_12160 [Komagataeibacter sucrofermentans]|uniref:Uncharacterized protein n=1 Tax=Komagataeibacter sucrofermentans TaxID=1053551 RepID=A0A318R514_9PROT|nr:hypothetical protein [Komagataeibacter sucrofermentans]PYD81193.1 hypothetical protein CFR77_01375 [Komagataeibacter sucrofermentans]GBQ44935.1 hypothetical protein AA15973_0449 [Komagataeibacter sucrofermentans DSM 15973]